MSHIVRYPPLRRPLDSTIELNLVLPSGLPGFSGVGHPVLVVLDRDLAAEIRSPSSDRVILRGAWDYVNDVTWDYVPEPEAEAEISITGREMVAAQIEATIKLFRRGYLDRDWLGPRAHADVNLAAGRW